MAQLPELKDWKGLVENELNRSAYAEADILKIMYMCQDYLGEIQPIGQWVGQQQAYVTQMHRLLSEMYFTRFGKQPPPRPTEAPITEVLLDTPDSRRRAIREVALSIAKPGDNISDEAVLEELRRRRMKLHANNPTATISTILRGFKPQFDKVKDKRGVFTRRE